VIAEQMPLGCFVSLKEREFRRAILSELSDGIQNYTGSIAK
jgi:hypothetical protein